jgi:hypothetical protein
VREGKLESILRALAEELHARGKLKLEEAFIDASFTGAKKGLSRSGPPGAAKGRKSLFSPMITVFPLAVSIESASPHECQLVEGVLGHSFFHTLPARLIGDKAYDSDTLDHDLAGRYRIEMIAPHRGQRGIPRRMAVRCGVTAGVGEWNDSLPGCITFVGWLSAGSTTSRTALAWCVWVACKSCSGIYERLLVSQRHHGIDPRSAASWQVVREERHSP